QVDVWARWSAPRLCVPGDLTLACEVRELLSGELCIRARESQLLQRPRGRGPRRRSHQDVDVAVRPIARGGVEPVGERWPLDEERADSLRLERCHHLGRGG